MPTTRVAPAPRTATRRGGALRPATTSRVVVVERTDVAGTEVWRVRLHREINRKGMTGYSETTTTYLDGMQCKRIERDRSPHQAPYSKTEWTRIDMATAISPTRTKDVIDVGRLNQAVLALADLCQRFGPDNPPSPESLESILTARQNILEWREKARAEMSKVDAAVDVAESCVRKLLA